MSCYSFPQPIDLKSIMPSLLTLNSVSLSELNVSEVESRVDILSEALSSLSKEPPYQAVTAKLSRYKLLYSYLTLEINEAVEKRLNQVNNISNAAAINCIEPFLKHISGNDKSKKYISQLASGKKDTSKIVENIINLIKDLLAAEVGLKNVKKSKETEAWISTQNLLLASCIESKFSETYNRVIPEKIKDPVIPEKLKDKFVKDQGFRNPLYAIQKVWPSAISNPNCNELFAKIFDGDILENFKKELNLEVVNYPEIGDFVVYLENQGKCMYLAVCVGNDLIEYELTGRVYRGSLDNHLFFGKPDAFLRPPAKDPFAIDEISKEEVESKDIVDIQEQTFMDESIHSKKAKRVTPCSMTTLSMMAVALAVFLSFNYSTN